MPRPIRKRRMEHPPSFKGFKPAGNSGEGQIRLLFEEYESVRLADYEGLTHAQAAIRMHISRPTFSRIYDRARKKLARALCESLPLSVEGGNVIFDDQWYKCQDCHSVFHLPKTLKLNACPECGYHFEAGPEHMLSEEMELEFHSGHDFEPQSGFCECVDCGFKMVHKPGEPCKTKLCPSCDLPLHRAGRGRTESGVINYSKNMIIAISAHEGNQEAKVDEHFGRCAFFMLFNKSENTYTAIENPGKQASGGAGAIAANALAENGVKEVYSGDYGPKAVTALNQLGIEFKKLEKTALSVEEVIEQVIN